MIWTIACTLWICTVAVAWIQVSYCVVNGNLGITTGICATILTILSILQETGVI